MIDVSIRKHHWPKLYNTIVTNSELKARKTMTRDIFWDEDKNLP